MLSSLLVVLYQKILTCCRLLVLEIEVSQHINLKIIFRCSSHLSKDNSDLKLNGAGENTPFSGILFNDLKRGVVCFVPSNPTFWMVKIIQQPMRSISLLGLKSNSWNKTNTPREMA